MSSPRVVFSKEDIIVEHGFMEHIRTRCGLGDPDACFVSSLWGLVGDEVIAYRGADRAIAIFNILIADPMKRLSEAVAALRELGFDVSVHSGEGTEELISGLAPILLQRFMDVDFATSVALLNVGGHILPFTVPGFIAIRNDGTIGGTVIAPQWLVPRPCFTYVGDALYANVRGYGTYSVDNMDLLTPAPLTHLDVSCRLKLPRQVVVRFVEAHNASFSILYNGFAVFKWRNANELVWTDEFREELAPYKDSEYGLRNRHYVNRATTYRLSTDELLNVLLRVRERHPRSRVSKLISVVKAFDWLRENARDMLSLLSPKASSSG